MESKPTMKAIARTKDGKNSPFLIDLPIPKPTKGSVIIKVLASPINPSDEAFSKGFFYGELKTEPVVCGFEGAGVITEVGEGVPADAVGKRVAVWPMVGSNVDPVGLWSQYARVPYDACAFIPETHPIEEYCALFVNPLTVLGFVRLAKELKIKTIVHTAALSSLGKILLKICKLENIDIIGVIRKKEDLPLLLQLGAKSALDSTDPKFVAKLREETEKYGARLAFDAIGGTMTATIIKGMPNDSYVYTYGVLAGAKEDLKPVEKEMKDRKIMSKWFLVGMDKIMADPTQKANAVKFIQDDVNKGGQYFKINVVAKYKLDEFKTALVEHMKTATKGKTVFTPNA